MVHGDGMSGEELSAAERRVWARLPDGSQQALSDLPPTDLQTLLLSVARTRASRVRPAHLLRRWRTDRFVRPAAADPRQITAIEARLWQLLPAQFDGVELSPVVPIGTCSALGPVSQNRVVTTTRSSEVLSDSTNALAIEAADRRLRQQSLRTTVHLAASHRLLRAQRFGPGASAHFRLFSLVSSGRDTGCGNMQAQLLTLHLGYWQRVLAAVAPAAVARLHYTVFGNPVVRERIDDTVLPAVSRSSTKTPTVTIAEEADRDRGRGYYVDAALRITGTVGEEALDLGDGDGGFTTWTAQLMGDAKERCLTSCVSVERLASLAAT
jgi:hypothetical protein